MLTIKEEQGNAGEKIRQPILSCRILSGADFALTPWCRWPDSNRHALRHLILSYSSHSEPNGLNRNKTVFSVTFQSIKNPKKPYKISIFDAKPQKHKQFVPSSIIGSQIPNLRRWRDVGGI